MKRALATALVALIGFSTLGCPLFGDPTPIVDACERWEAVGTEVTWLTARTSLTEIEAYLHEKNVACVEEILAKLEQHDRRGSQFWRFRNPGNRPPALVDGYAVVADGVVVTSFYKIW